MPVSGKKLRVGIVGIGAIGLGSAAMLSRLGLQPVLWSPRGTGTTGIGAGESVTAHGAVVAEFCPLVAKTPRELVENCDIIKITAPAYIHKDIMDVIAPYLEARHVVIISSHASFGALYLSKLLAQRDVAPLIVAWGTTVLTGRKSGATQVNVNSVRKQVDIATVPQSRADEGLQICQALFGDRFVVRDGLMAIALSNLNPQNHLGIALCNLTRMEKGEIWEQAANITPAVGRLLEKLDEERLAIARGLGLNVRNIFEHFSLSFHVARGSVADMSEEMVRNGHKGCGPATLDTRYVSEDVPYGLVPTVWLGRKVGHPAILHEAGITMFNALYGQDFTTENNLMSALDMQAMTLEELQDFSHNGARKNKYGKAGIEKKNPPNRILH